MSVRLKVFLCLVGVATLLWLASAYMAINIFVDSFKGIDEKTIQRSVDRIQDIVEEKEKGVVSVSRLWASGSAFTALSTEQSSAAFLEASGMNMAAFVDMSGKVEPVHWRNAPVSQGILLTQGDAAQVAKLVGEAQSKGAPISGIMNTAYGPMMFAAIALNQTQKLDQTRVGFVAGKFLDQRFQNELREQMLRNVEFLEPTGSLMEMFKGKAGDAPIVVPTPDPNSNDVSGYCLLRDSIGEPALIIKVTEGKAAYISGSSNLRFFLGISAGLAILVVVLATILVEALVTGRIRKLTKSAKHADHNGMSDLPKRMTSGSDEIASLARVTKSMVDRLRASQLLYRAVIESQADLIIRFKLDGEITFINQAFARFVGRHQKTVVGKNLSAFFNEKNTGIDFVQTCKEVTVLPKPEALEVEYRQPKEGTDQTETHWLEWSVRLLSGEDGMEDEIQAVGHDVTFRREYAAQLETAKNAAEASKEEAIGANRAKSEFLAIMGHETRTPLTSILGFVSILERTPLNPEQKEYIELIRASGNSLLALLNDLNDYANLSNGAFDLRKATIRVTDLVKEIISTSSPEARAKNLDLESEIDLDAPDFIEADDKRLRQVLYNLVDNGIKFTNQGYVRLGVRASGDRQVQFWVKDTGVGITEEGHKRLFQPFAIGESDTRGYGGAGLGLTICRKLVEQMGGEIQIKSQPGLGSLFAFSIPIGNPVIEASAIPAPLHPVQEKAAAQRESGEELPAILVVEDNAINRKVACRMIEMLGFACESAESGGKCLEMAKAKHYDIVFMDIQMPEMDGYETVRNLRKMEALNPSKRSYIIACTAFNLPGDRERCLEAGMDNYVSKPLQSSPIREAIQTAMEHPSYRRKSGSPPSQAEKRYEAAPTAA